MSLTTPRFFNRLLRSLLQHQWIRRLQGKYPDIFRWVIQRFDSSHFEGLPLTLALGILVINGTIFSEIAENIVNSEPMVKVDQQVSLFCSPTAAQLLLAAVKSQISTELPASLAR